MKILLVIIGSYVVGSFPTAYLMGKLVKGIDIREHGSHNMGATNVIRVVGKIPGLITLVIDIIKGLAVIVAVGLIGGWWNLELARILAGLAVIAGHNWPVFLGFKGGKGVATSAGVFLGLVPKPLAAAVLIFAAVFTISRKVSLSSLLAVLFLPFLVWFFKEPKELLAFSIFVSAIIIIRHIPNIKRLLQGTEEKLNIKYQVRKKK
jgi:acyl phosphate:glycerol-3-phosphate acyltransferase